MTTPPGWFYAKTRVRVASYIGVDAALIWTKGRFFFLLGWLFAVPIALSFSILAQVLTGGGILWWPCVIALIIAIRFFYLAIKVASDADASASKYLASIQGHRVTFSCPVTPWTIQWKMALARAQQQRFQRVALVKSLGIDRAVEQLVAAKRQSQVLTRLAMGLAGFLGGFIATAILLFLYGTTQTGSVPSAAAGGLAVLVVLVGAFAAGIGLPLGFNNRFREALSGYRRDVTQELTDVVVDLEVVPPMLPAGVLAPTETNYNEHPFRMSAGWFAAVACAAGVGFAIGMISAIDTSHPQSSPSLLAGITGTLVCAAPLFLAWWLSRLMERHRTNHTAAESIGWREFVCPPVFAAIGFMAGILIGMLATPLFPKGGDVVFGITSMLVGFLAGACWGFYYPWKRRWRAKKQ